MCVPSMGIWYGRYQIIPEGEVPYVRESCPEALASRKVVHCEVCTEGSKTANPGSNV
jgi:hypothetical protein